MSDMDERIERARGFDRQYHPCRNGLHVCGIDDDNDGLRYGPHFTVSNAPFSDSAAAQALYEAAREELAAEDFTDADMVVDLFRDGDCIDNFPMMRQMLDRFNALADAHLKGQETDSKVEG